MGDSAEELLTYLIFLSKRLNLFFYLNKITFSKLITIPFKYPKIRGTAATRSTHIQYLKSKNNKIGKNLFVSSVEGC